METGAKMKWTNAIGLWVLSLSLLAGASFRLWRNDEKAGYFMFVLMVFITQIVIFVKGEPR